jgi:hypothetical protein
MADIFAQHEFGAAYMSAARQQIEEMEKIFASDAENFNPSAAPAGGRDAANSR